MQPDLRAVSHANGGLWLASGPVVCVVQGRPTHGHRSRTYWSVVLEICERTDRLTVYRHAGCNSSLPSGVEVRMPQAHNWSCPIFAVQTRPVFVFVPGGLRLCKYSKIAKVLYHSRRDLHNTAPSSLHIEQKSSAVATHFVTRNNISDLQTVTKVTVHLPPTATHLLGECTLPPRALLLASSDASDEVSWDEVKRREDEDKMYQKEKMKMNITKERRWRGRCRLFWTIRTVY